jgi:formate hydrogenlyase subunit 3/multisubunit Na+/H+ antiporter MnhD subunit
MNKRYPSLRFVAIFLKIIGAAIIIFGVGFCLWSIVESDWTQLSRIYAIAGIVGSVLVGVLLYALGELTYCIMDIEANTRANIKGSSITEKQRQIARLQSEIAEELEEGKAEKS